MKCCSRSREATHMPKYGFGSWMKSHARTERSQSGGLSRTVLLYLHRWSWRLSVGCRGQGWGQGWCFRCRLRIRVKPPGKPRVSQGQGPAAGGRRNRCDVPCLLRVMVPMCWSIIMSRPAHHDRQASAGVEAGLRQVRSEARPVGAYPRSASPTNHVLELVMKHQYCRAHARHVRAVSCTRERAPL